MTKVKTVAAAEDSDCEIIEIDSGSSNSASATKRGQKKRRLVEDDDEGSGRGSGDDDTAGKENIEAERPEQRSGASSEAQSGKRKRPKDSSSQEPGEIVKNGLGQPSCKQIRAETVELGQVTNSIARDASGTTLIGAQSKI